MRVRLYPSIPSGRITAPPSKSVAHRLLLCAGLAQGESVIRGVAPSQDTLATADCLRALGADFRFEGEDVIVCGTDPTLAREAVYPCRESGSTLRFFLPICMLSEADKRLEGSPKLLSRPLSVYEKIAAEQALFFEKGKEHVTVRGKLQPGTFSVEGGISSQFISGLLFALPLLENDSRIRIIPPVESRSYIEMTRDALRRFGIRTDAEEENTFRIPGGQRYRAQRETVEGDWSNAAFFLAMGIPVDGLDENSLQGDRICREYFHRLEQEKAELDIADCPDLGPVLFAYAALHHGGIFTGTGRLRIKESDRGEAMKEELRKFGVETTIEENRITVGCGISPPTEALNGHNDHRIVMALTVLCVQTGGVLCGAEAVRKSFPDFFARLEKTGVRMEIENGMDIEK